MRKDSMHAIRAVGLCLLLAACEGGADGGGDVVLDAASSAKATQMLKDYEAARAAGNPAAAEAAADRLRERFPDSAAAQQLEATLADVRAGAEVLREMRRLQALWDYQQIAVDGGTQHSASIFSRTVDLGEDQPAPIPDAQLVLRDHPAWGRSVYLLLQQSKFDCGRPCTLQLAFDDAPMATWPGKQADSGKGPALFIEDEPRFVKALESAKLLKVRLPEGSGSLRTLSFEVGGFAAGSYARP